MTQLIFIRRESDKRFLAPRGYGRGLFVQDFHEARLFASVDEAASECSRLRDEGHEAFVFVFPIQALCDLAGVIDGYEA